MNIPLWWHWQWPPHLPPVCSLKFLLSLTPRADIGDKAFASCRKQDVDAVTLSPTDWNLWLRWLSEESWGFRGRVICGAGGCVRPSLAGRRIWEGRGKSKVIESLTTSLLCTISIKGQNTKILCWEFEQTGKSKVTEIVLRFKWPGLKYITNYHVQYFLLLQTWGGPGIWEKQKHWLPPLRSELIWNN